jgi:hypothetical protein
MFNAQEWLDANYPKSERSEVEILGIDCSSFHLGSSLDLGDFTELKKICVRDLGGNKLKFKNKPEQVEVIKLTQVRDLLLASYPKKEDKENLTKLDIFEAG